MIYKLIYQNNVYIMEVRKEGYCGCVQWSITKPTQRQVRCFIKQYKLINKLFDKNTALRLEKGE